jgi:secondary thiamine-phosphate synthase enzyme
MWSLPMVTKTVLREFSVKTTQREELIELTAQIDREIQASGIHTGLCHLTVLHTTAAIWVNEAEPGLLDDLLRALSRLVPADGEYAHPDGNGHAHIKAGLIGPSKTLPIQHGRLLRGTWQDLFLAEFDGPRERKIALQLIPT